MERKLEMDCPSTINKDYPAMAMDQDAPGITCYKRRKMDSIGSGNVSPLHTNPTKKANRNMRVGTNSQTMDGDSMGNISSQMIANRVGLLPANVFQVVNYDLDAALHELPNGDFSRTAHKHTPLPPLQHHTNSNLGRARHQEVPLASRYFSYLGRNGNMMTIDNGWDQIRLTQQQRQV